MSKATYVVRLTPDAEPVRFPAVSQEDMGMVEIAELEVRLGVTWDQWAYFHTQHVTLWHSARVAGKLADLLPPDERDDLESIPGILEGVSWDAVGRLTSRQVSVDVPDDADTEGAGDPPAAARE